MFSINKKNRNLLLISPLKIRSAVFVFVFISTQRAGTQIQCIILLPSFTQINMISILFRRKKVWQNCHALHVIHPKFQSQFANTLYCVNIYDFLCPGSIVFLYSDFISADFLFVHSTRWISNLYNDDNST